MLTALPSVGALVRAFLFWLCATNTDANDAAESGLHVKVLYPLDGTDIDHRPLIPVKYEVVNFDSVSSPGDYLFCMSFEVLANDGCLPLTTMWPADSTYEPVLRDTIYGERVLFMHIIDPDNRTISVAKSTFYVKSPGKSKEDTLDIYNIRARGETDPNRKGMFDYVFENQAWGRRADVFKHHGSREEMAAKGLAFLPSIQLKGGYYVLPDTEDEDSEQKTEFENARQNQFDPKHLNDADDYSRSGPGSTLAASHLIRRSLVDILKHYGIAAMLDVPCGDLHWMTHVDLSATPLRRYVGADISTSLQSYNRQKIQYMSTLIYMQTTFAESEFQQATSEQMGVELFRLFHDATAAGQYAQFVQSLDGIDLPQVDLVSMTGQQIFDTVGDVDLLFNRHMMYHLSPKDNLRVLQHVQEYAVIVLTQRRVRCVEGVPSESNLLIKCDKRPFFFMASTSLLKMDGNDDDYVLLLGNVNINLLRPPYCMKHPLAFYRDGPDPNTMGDNRAGTPGDMYMGLWAMYSPYETFFSSATADGRCA